MAARLENKRIAILATDGFEQSELDAPLRALIAERARVDVVSVEGKRSIRGWASTEWGETVPVDRDLSEAKAEDYDGLVLPGGLFNPDALRQDVAAVSFVRDFFEADKPVAAICHAPWLLAEAGAAEGRRITSYPSIRTDLSNAGANWVNEPVVRDGSLVTSRSPRDMEAFLRETIAAMEDSPSSGATAAAQ